MEDSQKYKEGLQNRLGECSIVVDELENSVAWKVLLRDTKKQQELIDSNWQDTKPEKIEAMKALKRATMHILAIPDQYKQEKEIIEKELDDMENPDKVIQKDYDNE